MDLRDDPVRGFVKVLDFGIAKVTDDGTRGGHTVTGNMMGTAPYMSPEQLIGGLPVDYQADLWALGVVAYKALTGKLPFNGATLGAVSIAVNAGTFTLPGEAHLGHAGGHPQTAGPARNETARPAPVAAPARPAAIADTPPPPALLPAIDPNDLPSTTSSTARTSGVSSAVQRRPAPHAAHPGAGAPPPGRSAAPRAPSPPRPAHA